MSWFDYNDPEYANEINAYLFKHQKRRNEKKAIPMLLCKCPVCKATLGKKENNTVETFHCTDCKADYTFYGSLLSPIGRPDRFCPKTCNCPACKSRYSKGLSQGDEKPQIRFEPDWDESDLP